MLVEKTISKEGKLKGQLIKQRVNQSTVKKHVR